MNENDYVMESKDIDLNCSDNITNKSDNDFLKKNQTKKRIKNCYLIKILQEVFRLKALSLESG